MNIATSTKIITGIVTLGGMIFEIGRQSHRLDSIFPKLYAMEEENRYIQDIVGEINIKLSVIDEKVSNVEKEVSYIRNKMDDNNFKK